MEYLNLSIVLMQVVTLLMLSTHLTIYAINNANYYRPIVLWHGMGDSCCFPFSIGGIKRKLEAALPNTYIRSIKVGERIVDDVENGYLMHPDKQITLVCKMLQTDGNLTNSSQGFNAIGFSQGAQFLRGLIQRCPNLNVYNLISIGGQHQGIYGLPNCHSVSYVGYCDYVRKLLNEAAYFEWVQKTLVQATFWHDPLHEATYRKYSTFLADINNERSINTTYIDRLTALHNLIMVKFDNDSIVQPVITEWFGFYMPNQSVKTQTLQQSQLYREDRLGLKQLDEQNKLVFLNVSGNHLQFDWAWFQESIVDAFLKE